MKAMRLVPIVLALALLLISGGTLEGAVPVGTAFTYQGQLIQSGVPVSGSCDFQFGLFDSATAGTQVGTTQTASAVTISNGLFTSLLDFGVSPFAGDARFLEISVRCPSAPSGAYTLLSPRQKLTPTPYAIFSQTVADNSITSAKIADGTITGADVSSTAALNIASLSTTGNVGIGTTSPATKLDVDGQITINDGSFTAPALKFDGVSTGIFRGTDGRIELVTGGFTALQVYDNQLRINRGTVGGPGMVWDDNTNTGLYGPAVNTVAISTNGSEKVRIDTTGNVGIGTTGPLERLEVTGGARFGQAPATSSTLSAAMTSADTTATVVSTTGYPSAGTLLIDFEAMTYTGTTANTFTGLTRGALGTPTGAHFLGSRVKNYLFTSLATSTTPRMVITGDGEVGIGTTTPIYELDVAGRVRATYFQGDGANLTGITASSIADNSITSAKIADGAIVDADINSAAAIADTKLATIASAGKVSGAALTGLASIPGAAGVIPAVNTPLGVSVGASELEAGSVSGGVGGVLADGTITGADVSSTAALNIASLSTTGNVGIGTTSPGSKLQVMGHGLFGDLLMITSSGQFGTNTPAPSIVSSRQIEVQTFYTANTNIKISNAGGGYLVTFNLDTSGPGGASGIFAVYCDPRYNPVCSSSQLVFLKEVAEGVPTFSFIAGELYMSFPNNYDVGGIRVLRLN